MDSITSVVLYFIVLSISISLIETYAPARKDTLQGVGVLAKHGKLNSHVPVGTGITGIDEIR